MMSKSSVNYRIKGMAKGKAFDFNKLVLWGTYKESQYDTAIKALHDMRKNGDNVHSYHLITEITTQVLTE